MRRFVALALLALGILCPAIAFAGERASSSPPPVLGPHPPIWRFNKPAQEQPFPRSTPSQAVWNDGSCWSQCGAYCAWGLNQCLYDDATQGNCVVNTDSCDLICQRACRSSGGPFLPID